MIVIQSDHSIECTKQNYYTNRAVSNVAEGLFPIAPNPTPTARPSSNNLLNKNTIQLLCPHTWYIMDSNCNN